MELYLAEQLLQKAVEEGQVPGAALALVKKEESVSICVGNSELLPEKKTLELDAVFDLASLTKVVAVTTLALQCMEKGLFTLKTPIASILTDFPHKEVTIGHLMTHTSGVCHDDKAYKELRGKEEIRSFFYQKPLEFAPGSMVKYSDFGYITLGFVIEEVYGALDERFQTCIAEPLEMKDSGYLPKERELTERCVPTEVTKDRGLVKGVVHDGKAWRMGGVSGNAGLFSTIGDLEHFVQMILKGGTYHGKQVLQSGSIDLLKKCYTEKLNLRRTLGWVTDEPTMTFGDYYSSSCIYHTGFTGTSIYIDFARECGIILLTNRVHPSRENTWIAEIRNRVHNVVLASL